MVCIDAHLHLQDPRLAGRAEELLAAAEAAGVKRWLCNATREADWAAVVGLAEQHGGVVPFLGIHPWFAAAARPGWQRRLTGLLSGRARGGGIGETGLDRARSTDFVRQRELFDEHLAIGADLGVAVAVHCVRAWGVLLDMLEARAARGTLPALMIHAFNGSTETMRRLAAIGCFISYSEALTDPGNIRLRETFRQTPLTALLLETDAPFRPVRAGEENTVGADGRNELARLTELYRHAAALQDLEYDEFSERIWHNATILTDQAAAR